MCLYIHYHYCLWQVCFNFIWTRVLDFPAVHVWWWLDNRVCLHYHFIRFTQWWIIPGRLFPQGVIVNDPEITFQVYDCQHMCGHLPRPGYTQ
jgi:hypothetical protein